MDQLRNVFKLSKTQLVSLGVRSDETLQRDSFAQELLDLWDSRKMEGCCFTVYLYSMPVGFLLLEITNRRTTIRGLWVNPLFRKQGVGEMLINAAKDAMTRSILYVNANESAIGFYEKQGFEMMLRRKDFPDQYKMFYYEEKNEDREK